MLDMTSFDAALKQYYTPERVQNMVYKSNPLLALMPKDEKFGGKSKVIPIIYGNPQGRSATFTNAQTRGAATNSKIKDFVVTRVKDYSIATIDNETIQASKGDKYAFMEAAMTEIDGAINSLRRSIAVSQYRSKAGEIGQVNVEPTENASTFDVALKSRQDISNLEIGMMVVIHSARSGGTQRISETGDNEWEVAAVNRSAGTLTLTGTYDSDGTIAANDYLFIEGDRGAKMSGLIDWIPATAPTSTPFFNVDRSVDTVRLGGVRYDGSAVTIEEALIEGASRVADEGGGAPDFCFVSFSKYSELEKALGSKVQYINLDVNAEVGFRGIIVNGPEGMIRVLPDRNCLNDYAFMLQIDTWKCCSIGPAVRVIDTDGLKMLRQASADGVEVRYGFYGNVACSAPGYNGIITL